MSYAVDVLAQTINESIRAIMTGEVEMHIEVVNSYDTKITVKRIQAQR